MAEKGQGLLAQLRPLRVVLILAGIVAILGRPEIGEPVVYSGWGVVTTLLIPVLAPILFMLLLLDALMSRVWMSEAQGEEKSRLRLVMRVDLIVGLLMLLSWLPFFIALSR